MSWSGDSSQFCPTLVSHFSLADCSFLLIPHLNNWHSDQPPAISSAHRLIPLPKCAGGGWRGISFGMPNSQALPQQLDAFPYNRHDANFWKAQLDPGPGYACAFCWIWVDVQPTGSVQVQTLDTTYTSLGMRFPLVSAMPLPGYLPVIGMASG